MPHVKCMFNPVKTFVTRSFIVSLQQRVHGVQVGSSDGRPDELAPHERREVQVQHVFSAHGHAHELPDKGQEGDVEGAGARGVQHPRVLVIPVPAVVRTRDEEGDLRGEEARGGGA